MRRTQIYFALLLLTMITAGGCSCSWFPYKTKDVSIDPDVKTFRVDYIENKARYINPQLSPRITDKLRQKITAQTSLKPSTGEAHLEISGFVSEYSVTTSGVSDGRNAITNRLNISITVEIKNNPHPEKSIQSVVSRNFDFPAQLTIAQAEARLGDEIVKNVVDEIFNKIFSNW
jgi:hypothetical protein